MSCWTGNKRGRGRSGGEKGREMKTWKLKTGDERQDAPGVICQCINGAFKRFWKKGATLKRRISKKIIFYKPKDHFAKCKQWSRSRAARL